MADEPVTNAAPANAADPTARDLIVYQIDTPDTLLVRSDGAVAFAGWAVSTAGRPLTLRVHVDDDIRTIPFEVSRVDVLEVLDLDAGDPLCGFGFSINSPAYLDGARVELEFEDGAGRVRTTPYALEYIGFRRSHYQEVWNSLTETEDSAKLVVAGFTDEGKFEYEAEKTRRILTETVGVRPDDVVDEWDRYRYVQEAWRVLRPGGRLYADNFSLLSDKGWELFEHTAREFHPHHRPAHISKSSTPQELYAYFQRAGFVRIRQIEDEEWIRTYGIKER